MVTTLIAVVFREINRFTKDFTRITHGTFTGPPSGPGVDGEFLGNSYWGVAYFANRYFN